MDKVHPLSLMIVRSFDINKNPILPYENDEQFVRAEIPYLSAV